ncbi:MAG: PEP-CTERM sorting domain-containing protein [Candidatus Accumulibacter sp.]|uniref:PEP-CTERM sorting domain-containing protein n=2 Tax=Candidatus Accumulibacter cognatus TaxID=2954383 RepID=A0A7D5SU84_9PROT|nr:PEP-CTERM sorting domain-containing protein [Accumulibacter sp.]MBO3712578.1 PEP-CTERM sorting domain-containing protein [Accumulibacter sp.]QLH51563.1 MAG: PEP-CTERM sorting domain-containing protein [Candidatus Accumulibacter cognatus]
MEGSNMKRSRANLLYAISAAGLLGLSLPASADFSGYYGVPGSWTLTNSCASPSECGTGSYTSGAPASVTVIGSDVIGAGAGVPFSSLTSFTIIAGGAGLVHFDWSYETLDVGDPLSTPPVPSAFFDTAGYLLNGSTVQVTDLSGAASQSGSFDFSVAAGDVFGFYVETIDNLGGAAMITISNFRAPLPPPPPPGLPEPYSIALLALGLVGVAASRKRRTV